MMRARLVLAAAAIVALSGSSTAQTRTADGVDAFLGGDYARAAAILKPLAETIWKPDHTAEFVMAVMYESGLGVPADPLRACALLIRASTDRDNPLATAANGLVRGYQRRLGGEGFETCNWRASHGFDDRFDPVTFTLDQEHWIAWDLKGATITYRGVDKRVNLGLASRNVRFVSMHHAELASGPALSTRRHFIDIFRWIPSAQPRTWTLTWALYEVSRDELISVTSQPLITATGEEPPAASATDPAALVTLRVNDDGDPEYAILAGAARQTTVIESDAERQEWKRVGAQQARVRQAAADSRTARVLDVHRRPGLVYAADAADGCGNIFVYGWTGDRAEVITVRADRQPLQNGVTGTFDLGAQTTGLEVQLHVYERAMPSFPFCTDVGAIGLVEEVWRPTRGTVTIQLSGAGLPVRAPGRYRATVAISGAQFVSPSGARVDQGQPITLTAIVGGFQG